MGRSTGIQRHARGHIKSQQCLPPRHVRRLETTAASRKPPLREIARGVSATRPRSNRHNDNLRSVFTLRPGRSQGEDSTVYWKAGDADGDRMWLYLLRDEWVIARRDEDWYTAKASGPRPPVRGWNVMDEHAQAPAPEVYAVGVRNADL
jgi:hypothetical protein